MQRLSSYALALVLLASMTGCITSRANQFNDFAQAGTAYVQASQIVLDQAGSAAIDADSLVALTGREGLKNASERRHAIVIGDEELLKRLRLLEDIRHHEELLQEYFESLAALANPQTTPALETCTDGFYGSILTLSPSLMNGSLGGANIRNKIPQATDIMVQTFSAAALDHQLKLRAKDIERELALQQAAFQVIADNLMTDLTVRLQLLETQQVIEPYATGKPSLEWVLRRQDILKARVTADATHCIVDAAAKLRENFVALVENRLDPAALVSFVRSIHSIHDIKEKIQKAGL